MPKSSTVEYVCYLAKATEAFFTQTNIFIFLSSEELTQGIVLRKNNQILNIVRPADSFPTDVFTSVTVDETIDDTGRFHCLFMKILMHPVTCTINKRTPV